MHAKNPIRQHPKGQLLDENLCVNKLIEKYQPRTKVRLKQNMLMKN